MSRSRHRLPRLAVSSCAAIALTIAVLAPVDTAGANPDVNPAVKAARPAPSQAAPARNDGGSRASSRNDRDGDSAMTLDAITIEGEIDVPQVLFITSRDHLRRSDLLHHLYLADLASLATIASSRSGVDVSAVRPSRRAYVVPAMAAPVARTDEQQHEE